MAVTGKGGQFRMVQEIIIPAARNQYGETNPVVANLNAATTKISQTYLKEVNNEAAGNRIVRYALVLLREKDGVR